MREQSERYQNRAKRAAADTKKPARWCSGRAEGLGCHPYQDDGAEQGAEGEQPNKGGRPFD